MTSEVATNAALRGDTVSSASSKTPFPWDVLTFKGTDSIRADTKIPPGRQQSQGCESRQWCCLDSQTIKRFDEDYFQARPYVWRY
ncbi:hypothetical protein BaRGS_00000690 [Batillaria attramentaria]|uniref:Uncharacterized protein n=1 Tax=Batillaria attramentaria TaxID=370345 RepID=A0ABD0M715_9CAEN